MIKTINNYVPTNVIRRRASRGVAMCKGGGPWPPQNFEIFLNIYIIILIFSKFSLKNKS